MMAPGVLVEGRALLADRILFAPLRLEIKAECWTCLLGASGVGKSTILRLIAGLENGAEFEGQISADDDGALPERIAYMAQSDLLLPWATALDNIVIGSRLRGERPELDRAKEMLNRVGLSAQGDKRPSAMSGGERQRIALARTLMEDRPVILLDEPFSALDARTRAEMQELAAELLADRTVLLVTHDPAEAARMGAAIFVLTPTGLEQTEPPAAAPIRAIDDPETLAAQGRLHRRLLERA
ncbi:MAG: ATP-binding cassette domain-containing protein [Pseudomonadota bacterium]